MDIISHGLWGGLAFGRRRRRDYWIAFFIGLAPDLFSFGLLTAATILGLSPSPDWRGGTPSPDAIPAYVHVLYNYTHSLIIFAVAFGLIWLIRRKPYLPLLAWGLHIGMDIFKHSRGFFPTPFLWPLSSFTINGTPWSNPWIFFPNWIALIIGYVVWYLRRKRRKKIQSTTC